MRFKPVRGALMLLALAAAILPTTATAQNGYREPAVSNLEDTAPPPAEPGGGGVAPAVPPAEPGGRGVAPVQETAAVPRPDAAMSALPFTGFQIGLMALGGLAAIGLGLGLRRARPRAGAQD